MSVSNLRTAVTLEIISHRLVCVALFALALFIPFSIAGANFAIGIGLFAWLLSALASRTTRPRLDGARTDIARAQPGWRQITGDPLLVASVLLVASAVPSVLVSGHIARAFKDWTSYWLFAVYFLVAANAAPRRIRGALLWTLFASMTLSCLVAFAQRAGGVDLGFVHIRGEHRVGSTLFTMTFAGILYQMLVLYFALALRRGAREGPRAVLWAGLMLQFLALLLTVTRGAWLAFGAGLITVCALLRGRLAIATSAVALAAVFVFASVTARDSGRNVSPALLTRQVDIHAATRLVLWDVAWDLFKANPILGVGMGDYSSAADSLVGDRFVTTTTDTHNVYLQILATRGLVGFLPFAFFWVVVFRALLRMKRGLARGSIDWHLVVGGIAVSAAVLVGALTENNVDDEEVFIAYLFLLGLARSAVYASPKEAKDTGGVKPAAPQRVVTPASSGGSADPT